MICKHFNDCGGCDSQDKSYAEQLRAKKAGLEDLFSGFEGLRIDQIVASPEIWHYRNKMEYAVKRLDGKVLLGLRKKKRFNRVVDLEECPIFHEGVKAVFDIVKRWIDDHSIDIYNVFDHTGTLKYIALRHGKFHNEMMVTVVVSASSDKLERDRAGYSDLAGRLKAIPAIKSVYLCVNNGVADVAITDQLLLLAGEDHIKERINGIDYRIEPASFFQTNSYCCNKLYDVVKDEAAKAGGGDLVDLFCGSGGITLQLAQRFDKVTGVDISRKNIEDAKKSAAENRIDNAEFICEDADKYLSGLKTSGAIREISTIIVDPPRSGLSGKARAMLAESGVASIIYVSCNAETLKKDLEGLKPSYRIERMVPVDMFPHTRHVEVVAVLKKV